MAGRFCNKRLQRNARSRNNGPKLRQTKLVLRVTARRLSYNNKPTLKEVNKSDQNGLNVERKESTSNALQNSNLSDSFSDGKHSTNSEKERKVNGDTRPASTAVSKDCHDSNYNSVIKTICRPRRNVPQKKMVETCGLSWKEETELKKALYASLQRKKIKLDSSEENNLSNGLSCSDASQVDVKRSDNSRCIRRSTSSDLPSPEIGNSDETSPLNENNSTDVSTNEDKNQSNTRLFRAQRKFACGTKPTDKCLARRRKFQKKIDCSVQNNQIIPYTEDFINYLCLRGTPYLPESLKFIDNILCRTFETQLDTPLSCASAELELSNGSAQKSSRKSSSRKCARITARAQACLNLIRERNKARKMRRLQTVKRQQKRKFAWKKIVRTNCSNNSVAPVKDETALANDSNSTSGAKGPHPSAIFLRSGKVVSADESGRIQPKIGTDGASELLSLATTTTTKLSLYVENNNKRNVKGRSVDKLEYKKKFLERCRNEITKKKRRRRRGIELIDRSWNRSGLKRYLEIPRDGKQTCPITRSRTLASMEDDLNKAKMEIEIISDGDDDS